MIYDDDDDYDDNCRTLMQLLTRIAEVCKPLCCV